MNLSGILNTTEKSPALSHITSSANTTSLYSVALTVFETNTETLLSDAAVPLTVISVPFPLMFTSIPSAA